MANRIMIVRTDSHELDLTSRDTSFGVWDGDCPEDLECWLGHWRVWPGREVQAHPAYARLFVQSGSDRVFCAYWKSPSGNVLYPFISREIPLESGSDSTLDGCVDLTTPYGYGGPFFWGNDGERVAPRFWEQFDRWAREHRVVSEFIRFALFSDTLLPSYPGERVQRLTNVVCSLEMGEEEIWKGVKSKVRRNVKKARREGVKIQFDETGELASEFQRIYYATMRRRSAGRQYYFPPAFFEELQQNLAGQFTYCHALHQGTVISSELVLISSDRVYFFLGGTDADYYDLRPNDLLKYEIMLWARSLGKRFYVLGGGYRADDGVFRYKQSFAPDGLFPFYTGQRVFDTAVYERLTDQHVARRPLDHIASDFFPAYRTP